jgi:ATP-dependent helicase Lhr and Lhr-like helicase
MREIPRELSRAFFERFGGRPRPLQQEAFSVLIDSGDALICAPTSSGKTEAALLPIAHKLLRREADASARLGALIISPTRALASDLHTRMAPVFAKLGLRLDVATSDKNTCRTGVPSDVLIRTPEGLDATLCRSRESLAAVRDVMIDEIHTFMADPRGTQLVGLLQRLRSTAPSHRRIGVSATVGDLTLPGRTRLLRPDHVVVSQGEQGTIEYLPHRWIGSREQGADRFIRSLRELGCRKSIGFVRTRARAEEMAALLDRGHLRGLCLVHHGSTSSAIRRETEERLRRLPVAMVVATTTLEVGIDIGDVDTCILFDAPPDASALVQRAGRAGRRSGLRRVLYVTDLFDRAVEFGRLIARSGSSRSVAPGDARPFLSACFQQAVSYVASYGEVPQADVAGFLQEAFDLPADVSVAVISCLSLDAFLERTNGSVRLTPASVTMLANRTLHLTFASTSGSPVFDAKSLKRIGHAQVDGRGNILLGGAGRRIVSVDNSTGRVFTEAASGGNASFAPQSQSSFQRSARRHAARMGGVVRLED